MTRDITCHHLLLQLRFVEIVEELARQRSLHRLGIIPLMCASATTPYAQDLVTRLQHAAPSAVIHTRFLGSTQLAQVSHLSEHVLYTGACSAQSAMLITQRCMHTE